VERQEAPRGDPSFVTARSSYRLRSSLLSYPVGIRDCFAALAVTRKGLAVTRKGLAVIAKGVCSGRKKAHIGREKTRGDGKEIPAVANKGILE